MGQAPLLKPDPNAHSLLWPYARGHSPRVQVGEGFLSPDGIHVHYTHKRSPWRNLVLLGHNFVGEVCITIAGV
jgi:hypothetical protein